MNRDKLIDKMRKIQARCTSSNEHEAATAAAMLAEFMLKHQIAEAELAAESDSVPVEEVGQFCVDRSGKLIAWRSQLIYGLSDAFGCKYYQVPGIRGRRQAAYMVVGPQSSVDTVTYMYQYLAGEVDRLAILRWECDGYHEPYASARAWKSAFRIGCARTIAHRLRDQRKATLGEAKEQGKGTALMVLDKQKDAVTRFVAAKLNLRKGQGSTAGSSSGSGYVAGSEAGKTVKITRDKGSLSGGNRQLNR